MVRKWFLLGLVSLTVLPSCMNASNRGATAALDTGSTEAVAVRPISSGASDATGRYMIPEASQLQLTMQVEPSIQGDAQASALPIR